MSSAPTQENRPLKITTPLGDDAVLIERFEGRDAICELFDYTVTVLYPTTETPTPIEFDQLLGQSVTVEMSFPTGPQETQSRFFNGIIASIYEGEQLAGSKEGDAFLRYIMKMHPTYSLLRRKKQSRIFQHMTVPKILEKVIKTEGGVTDYADETTQTFEERDYCVQYRESDFDFCCRLMEEEGIFWFFRHVKDKHTLVLADASSSHKPLEPADAIIYGKPEDTDTPVKRINLWRKRQSVRSGMYTLWDSCFEMVGETFESKQPVLPTVTSGTTTHKLTVAKNDKLEIYDYQGGYAQRFDGIDKGGAPQPPQLQKIAPDGKRTVKLRMEQETMLGFEINATSRVRHFTSGSKFTLANHYDGNGDYVITEIEHEGVLEGAYSGELGTIKLRYNNAFACIPYALPYRPLQKTPKPVVHGSQTALVVGEQGKEISTDKYGRVKVQFPWDREGKKDLDSSCWIRVGTPWAGKQWGWIHIPRIGQEVIVDFIEGDPDQPIITGSVYNAEQMPPYELPTNSKYSTWKSNTTLGGKGFNEIRFDDTEKAEEVFIHAQKDLNERILGNRTIIIGKDDEGKPAGGLNEEVWKDVQYHYKANLVEHIEGNVTRKVGLGDAKDGGNVDLIIEKKYTAKIQGDTTVLLGPDSGNLNLVVTADHNQKVGGAMSFTVTGAHNEKVGGDHSLDLTGAQNLKIGGDYSLDLTGDYKAKGAKGFGFEATKDVYIKGMNVVIEAATALTIKAGSCFVALTAAGVAIMGPTVKIASGGSPGSGAPPVPTAPVAPTDAVEAAPAAAKPEAIADVVLMATGFKSTK